MTNVTTFYHKCNKSTNHKCNKNLTKNVIDSTTINVIKETACYLRAKGPQAVILFFKQKMTSVNHFHASSLFVFCLKIACSSFCQTYWQKQHLLSCPLLLRVFEDSLFHFSLRMKLSISFTKCVAIEGFWS